MSDDLTDRLVAAGNDQLQGLPLVFLMVEAGNEIERLRAEVERLQAIEVLAKKAQWLYAACWDLADGSGVFISTDSMHRFEEVFNSIGVATGQVYIDEEDERTMFDSPSALLDRAKTAESALAALRKRVGESVVAMVQCDYEGTTVSSYRYYDGSRMEGENFKFAKAEQDAIDALHGKRVALVVLD